MILEKKYQQHKLLLITLGAVENMAFAGMFSTLESKEYVSNMVVYVGELIKKVVMLFKY